MLTSAASRSEIAAEIEHAVRDADAAPEEPVEELTRFVYSEPGELVMTDRTSRRRPIARRCAKRSARR